MTSLGSIEGEKNESIRMMERESSLHPPKGLVLMWNSRAFGNDLVLGMEQ
jgi:hypothetical protein